jgi:hypothetical protein
VNYGLTPRPDLPPEELAALVAAVEEMLRSEQEVTVTDQIPNWRFSGRWFNAAPFSNRRPRLG